MQHWMIQYLFHVCDSRLRVKRSRAQVSEIICETSHWHLDQSLHLKPHAEELIKGPRDLGIRGALETFRIVPGWPPKIHCPAQLFRPHLFEGQLMRCLASYVRVSHKAPVWSYALTLLTCFNFPLVKVGEIDDLTCFQWSSLSTVKNVSPTDPKSRCRLLGMLLNSLMSAFLMNSGSLQMRLGWRPRYVLHKYMYFYIEFILQTHQKRCICSILQAIS